MQVTLHLLAPESNQFLCILQANAFYALAVAAVDDDSVGFGEISVNIYSILYRVVIIRSFRGLMVSVRA